MRTTGVWRGWLAGVLVLVFLVVVTLVQALGVGGVEPTVSPVEPPVVTVVATDTPGAVLPVESPTSVPTVMPTVAAVPTRKPTFTPWPTLSLAPTLLPTVTEPVLLPVTGGETLLQLPPLRGELGEGVPVVALTGSGLAAAVGVVLSLLLAYVPGFQGWWDTFELKRETLAAAGFVVAWTLVGLHYLGAVDLGLGAFGWPVLWQVIEAWMAFSGAGQLGYTVQQVLVREVGGNG